MNILEKIDNFLDEAKYNYRDEKKYPLDKLHKMADGCAMVSDKEAMRRLRAIQREIGRRRG